MHLMQEREFNATGKGFQIWEKLN